MATVWRYFLSCTSSTRAPTRLIEPSISGASIGIRVGCRRSAARSFFSSAISAGSCSPPSRVGRTFAVGVAAGVGELPGRGAEGVAAVGWAAGAVGFFGSG